MLSDIAILLGFWAMVLAPCLVAMRSHIGEYEAG